MFGYTSVAQQYLFAAGKVLRYLFQCLLRVVLFPGVISLVLLYVLYTIADYKFTNWYFGAHDFVWEPAFPWSWRLLFLSLFVVPAFSFLHLLWFSLHRLVLACHWWQRRYNLHLGPSQGYVMLPRRESNSLEGRVVVRRKRR
ncbi:hypothetical protein J3R83DRAFT_10769 [Lanmaoa asiatica]|nr:hypothetical protein J3R83DRAFT_10769 [Lanmaoa asiatica]